MFVLTVAPFGDGIPYEELSYFSKKEVFVGDLVEINIRKRICRALVVNVHTVKEERQSLRKSSFGLKKINKVLIKNFINEKLFFALHYISSYLLVPLGTLVYDLISEKAFNNLSSVVLPKDTKGFEILLLEQNYNNRITRYKTIAREYFSKKKSLCIFFPTITDLQYAYDELSHGIKEYVIVLHSELTDKQYKENQKEILTQTHPLLILSTPSLLPWTRADLGFIIVEREHSQYYFTHGTNGYDMRCVIQELANKSGIPCLLGSHMLSLHSHMLYKKKDAYEILPLQFRNDAPINIIPMTELNKSANPYLSKTALSILHNAKMSASGHYFLYAHRKGMYPTTICSDCGTLYVCHKCERPYVLHKIGGRRTYVCHGCEHIVQLDEDSTLACKHCGGWRMTTLGIATNGVEEELRRLGIPTFLIDGDHTNTRTKVKKVYKEWCESKYGVLIGTEMAHNVVRSCDGIIVLSLDSLFSIPEYRTDEKILNLITEMAEKIKESENNKLILQTRLPKSPVMTQLIAQSFREVYDTLLKEREKFLLPPYYTVIKASFTNLPDDMKNRMEQELEPYVIEWFEQGKGITLLFVHIKESEWAHNEIVRNRIKNIVGDGNPQINPLHFFI